MEPVTSKSVILNRVSIIVIIVAVGLLTVTSCNLMKSDDEQSGSGSSREAELALKNLQVNLQKNLLETVTVLAVIDNTVYGTDEGEETVTPEQQKEERLRRERLVRAALTSNLVRNSKLRIVNPPQALIDEFYNILKSKNANALSAEEVKKAGESLSVVAVITAFLEDEGKKINVVATGVADGKVIFNETLVEWDYEKSEESKEKSAEETAKAK